MTRQAFVRNTMSTIRDQQQTDPKWAAKKPNFMLAWEAHIEAYLKDMYISVKNYQILQPMHNSMEDTGDDNSFLSVSTLTNNKRMSMIAGKRMVDIKRSLNTMIHKSSSARDSMLFLDDPLVSYTDSKRKAWNFGAFLNYSASQEKAQAPILGSNVLSLLTVANLSIATVETPFRRAIPIQAHCRPKLRCLPTVYSFHLFRVI